MDIKIVNQYYQTHRATFPEPFRLRIHRAISWLEKAKTAASDYFIPGPRADAGEKIQMQIMPKSKRLKLQSDWDVCFIALWVAFNAAYAKDIPYTDMPSEKSSFRSFLQTVCSLDKERQIYRLVWETFPGSIRLLLDNRYVFQPFWDFHNGKISESAWQEAFDVAKRKANAALAAQDTEVVLSIVFERLYTLRNQMVHGGATYLSSANRSQLQDGCAFLRACVPQVLAVMMQHPQHEAWGKPFYPFVKGD